MNRQFPKRIGLTLVELLVAISILTIITALLVPRLRIINKDRNIRETARVVGSVFSSARDLAIAEGSAGVIIERNPNFVAVTGGENNRVFYAGTRLYQVQSKAAFTGDTGTDFGLVIQTLDGNGNPTLQCLINAPFDHDPDNGREVIVAGDSIELNNASYEVKEVLPIRSVTFETTDPMEEETLCGTTFTGTLALEMLPLNLRFDNNLDPTDIIDTNSIDVSTGVPAPAVTPGGENGPFPVSSVICFDDFKVGRLRRIQSSVVDLPAGYIIDLRYSGPLDSGNLDGDLETFSILAQGLADDVDASLPMHRDILVLFDRRGSLERLSVHGNSPLVGQSLHLFINEFSPSKVIADDTQAQAETLLAGEDSLWVTVGLNGGVNIAYNSPPQVGAVDQMISGARTISRTRTSARQ